MSNDDPVDWLQSFLPNDQTQDSHDQGLQQSNALDEHPMFADAARIDQPAHATFMRSQQTSRSAQENGPYQQFGINQTLSQLPLKYQFPYGQGQQGTQPPQRQQAPQRPQAHQGQQYRDAPYQQYVRPSDISSSPSLYQSNTSRRARGSPTPANVPSRSSVPAEMLAFRPTMAPQRPPQGSTQPPSHFALLEFLMRQQAPTTSHAGGSQSSPMPHAALPAALNQRPNTQVSNQQAAHQARPDSRYNQPQSRVSSMSTPVPAKRNTIMDASASSPRQAPYTSASCSTLGSRAHTLNVPAAVDKARPAKNPAVSASRPPKPTAAAPAISASSSIGTSSAASFAAATAQSSQTGATQRQPPSASTASSGPYSPPLQRKFLPHSTLLAPPRSGQHGRPIKYGVEMSSTSAPSQTLSTAQNTHNRLAGVSAGPSSNAVPSSQRPSFQQPRATGMVAQSSSSSAAQNHPRAGAPMGKDGFATRTQSVQDTESPNWHIHSGLPPAPTALGPSSTPVASQQYPALPGAPWPNHQPAAQTIQQPFAHGHGEAPPPSKIRRMQDGTKRAVIPSSGTLDLAQYGGQSPSRKHFAARLDLIQPLDANEADIKFSYDPTTIARDVLINANKHPTEKPLNHHLEILRSNFSAVDFSSDLDTFRWDLVDPDSGARDIIPHRSPARPAARPPIIHQHHNVPSSLGSLPFKPPSYHSRTVPTPTPVIAPPTSLPPRSTAQPHLPSPLPPPLPPVPRPPPPADPTAKPTLKATPPPAPPPTPATVHPATPSATGSAPKSPRPKPTQTPVSSAKSPSQPPRNKAYPQPQVAIATSPENMPPRKRKPGRPRKVSTTVEVAVPNEPSVPFPVFHCKWAKCQAELHNMRALQSHVLKGHVPHDITCGWEGCNDQTPMAASSMWAHVREEHIGPMAWALGDGPTVPATVDEKVTPSRSKRSSRQQRRGTIIWPVNQTVIESYSRVYGIRYPKQKAEALKEGGCHWKEGIGCELDQSARRLSSPATQAHSLNREVAYSILDGSTRGI